MKSLEGRNFDEWPDVALDPGRLGEIWREAMRRHRVREDFDRYLGLFQMPYAFGVADDNAFPDDIDREFYLDGASDA